MRSLQLRKKVRNEFLPERLDSGLCFPDYREELHHGLSQCLRRY